MSNFIAKNPTKLIFGKGQIKHLSSELSSFGKKVLLVYGGGSVKKTGLYDQIISELKNFEIFELSGVEPNPRVTTAQKGADLIKKHNIDVILAVGGGSVIDCTKLIATAAHYDGPAWDIVINKHTPTKATPYGTILTIAATGSEMNSGSVITNLDTKQKLSWGSPLVYPTFSILDPTYTFTLPKNQTVNGIVDMMSHLFEQYFNEGDNTGIQDAMIEGILREIIKNAPILLTEPENYEAREVIMMAGTLALNGYMRWGYLGDWSSHNIEHAVSAIYDIPHAEGLSIIMPNWMKYVMPKHVNRFAKMAENVFGLTGTQDEKAKNGIQELQKFWKSLGSPISFSERNINSDNFEQIAKHCMVFGDTYGRLEKLNYEDTLQILHNSL